MANLVQELNSLDFSVYIGGPLQAAVKAQHDASISQVNFIKEVGFTPAVPAAGSTPAIPSQLRYVDFNYEKSLPNPDYGKTLQDLKDAGRVEASATAIPATINVSQQFLKSAVNLKVPFLTMLTIPALRIDEVTIDFNAKLNSVETQNVSSEFSGNASISAKFWKVKFNASASYKKTTSSTSTTERTYTLGVHVRAVNDELPAGLSRIMDMLEDSIAAV
ncbi:MAG: DUF2589 domain-containing protein [Chlorobi bacterium]|jgi:hypothetical protein|uniref:DUF2589 domain-containing protein n=2 Tax=Chryseobacterium TaxID=59732 RepID=A0AAJ1R907_9FLAO|nr:MULTISPECIES: DUF2589 domain-containing protein [Chryseobacterium]NPA09148.1 DUF2589 domain-containing protein [Chlorobiota bacterium]MCF2221170.1 DUF2589 domain-containing protein [Chryseobacterium sp. PS-8]MDN4014442.1 DUF2589 domain-containing protein [Chryseobacterium gambrini]MDN4029789.1 DUF2589 domain-containing protein [Chryseobacterium gambrini]QWA37221.1 DUF2589 domain-containing protein [Chryseobacterium sp. ZHDP1]